MHRWREFAGGLLEENSGSALLELAVSLPLLVVFIVGIFDFSGALNQKQKMQSAAQEAAIIAAAQPTSDIESANPDPESLHPVVTVLFKSLAASGVLLDANQGTCAPGSYTATEPQPLLWTYSISGCPDTVNISINRAWVPAATETTKSVGTLVTVVYPYHWRFYSALQLLFPGQTFTAPTYLSETAKVHNQI